MIVTQDLDEDVIRASEKQRPADLTDRVRYQVHDFMTEQPVKQADVYFFRAIFHNWSHKYAMQILRNLVPALKPGAKIVIADYVIPSPDRVPKSQEAAMRTGIVSMNVLFNSADREMEEWTRLFGEADPRFDFKGGSQPLGSDLWVLEADWK
jgi:SAM-dependent methyltransferase